MVRKRWIPLELQIMNGKRDFESLEVWFVTGSQHLYGGQPLTQVADNSGHVVDGLAACSTCES
jgi:L-arabinose isomerase